MVNALRIAALQFVFPYTVHHIYVESEIVSDATFVKFRLKIISMYTVSKLFVSPYFLGACGKMRKATARFVLSVCLC